MIERWHRWIKERLSLIAIDGDLDFIKGTDDWSDYINVIQYTYNSTPNKMTNFCPMECVFGENKSRYVLKPYEFDPKVPGNYIKYMTNRRKIILNKANLAQEHYDKIRAKSYNKNKIEEYDDGISVGSKVLYNIAKHFVGTKRKIGSKWIGPFEVVKIHKDNPNSIQIQEIQFRDPTKPNYNPPNRWNVAREQIKPYIERYDDSLSPATNAMAAIRQKIETMHAAQIEQHHLEKEESVPWVENKPSMMLNLSLSHFAKSSSNPRTETIYCAVFENDEIERIGERLNDDLQTKYKQLIMLENMQCLSVRRRQCH